MSGHYDGLKNVFIKSTGSIFEKSISIQPESVQELFDCLLIELTESLDRVDAIAGSNVLAEQKGSFVQFDKKKE